MPEAALKPRVIHIMRAPVGGLFRHVTDLTLGLANRGFEVGIIADSTSGGQRANDVFQSLEPVAALGIHRIAMSRLPGISDMNVLNEIKSIASNTKAGILHGHGAKGGAYARFLAKRLNGKSVYTPHGGSLHYEWSSIAGFMFLSMEKYLAHKTDAYLFESAFGKTAFENKITSTNGKSFIVHNGLSAEEFKQRDQKTDREFDLVFIGELRGLKGVDTLIDAIQILEQQNTYTPSLLIVGAGPDRDAFIEKVKQYELEEYIQFHKPMPAFEAFEKAHLLIVPSKKESLPYIVLEAAAAKIPVITTDVGGISEIFETTKDYLLKPSDPKSLADTIEDALQNLSHQHEIAEERFRYVKDHFNLDAMVESVIKAYITTIKCDSTK
jgi:glycosyltransferase involved in cell wall biosynthesis